MSKRTKKRPVRVSEPLKLTDAQTFAFMAALMGGVTWGIAPDVKGTISGEDYCAGDRQIGDEIRFLLTESVIRPPSAAVVDPGPYRFELGKRPIRSE